MIIGLKKEFYGFLEINRIEKKRIRFILKVEIKGELNQEGIIIQKDIFKSIINTVTKQYEETVIDYDCHKNTLEILAKKIWDSLIIEISKNIKKKIVSKICLYQIELQMANFYIKIKRDWFQNG